MDDKEKQMFDEKQEKQAKLVKKYLLFVFGIMGLIFIIISIFLDIEELNIIFLILGAVMILLGIILYLVIPTKYNYNKYKSRVDKFGYINIYEINAKIVSLEERVEELEQKLKDINENM